MKFKRLICMLISVLIIITSVTVFGYAEEADVTVSPALAVISHSINLIKSGVCGEEITFSAEDFEQTLGTDHVDTVVILSLPAPESGKLMLGMLEVTENQTISRANIGALRFVPNGDEEVNCSFMFRAGQNEKYDLSCSLYILGSKNGSPSACDEKVMTYKNIAVFGSMTGSDPENDLLTYQVTKYPQKGILTFSDINGGGYIYTPMKNYIGNDGFSYTVADKYGNISEEKTVSIDVERSDSGVVYTDLIGTKQHGGAIKLTDMGVISGREDGDKIYFDPDSTVTCAEFLKMVMQTLGMKIYDDSVPVSAESDLLIPSSCRPYAAAAREKGIVTENAFRDLTADITKAEACVAVAKLTGAVSSINSIDDGIPDKDDIPSWAENAVCAMLDKQIISTEADGSILPNNTLTKSEIVDMLTVLLDLSQK